MALTLALALALAFAFHNLNRQRFFLELEYGNFQVALLLLLSIHPRCYFCACYRQARFVLSTISLYHETRAGVGEMISS